MESGTAIASIATQTIRKVRIRILSFVFVLYVICYLDRVNISIAAYEANLTGRHAGVCRPSDPPDGDAAAHVPVLTTPRTLGPWPRPQAVGTIHPNQLQATS